MKIIHEITNDCACGSPWPPITDHNWRIIYRLSDGRTLWRAIVAESESPSADPQTNLGGDESPTESEINHVQR
jgi:hypothetical protein